jgi:hypothetical protein
MWSANSNPRVRSEIQQPPILSLASGNPGGEALFLSLLETRMRVCWMITASLMIALGCGSEAAGPPVPVYPVKGIVTHNNEPVVGADVTFFNAEAKRSAFGRTNDRGEYQLTTFSANDGAVAGKHVVTIVKIETPLPTTPEASIESEAYDPPELGESTAPPVVKSAFPEKYGSATTSGLVAVVSADTPNENVDFKLTD